MTVGDNRGEEGAENDKPENEGSNAGKKQYVKMQDLKITDQKVEPISWRCTPINKLNCVRHKTLFRDCEQQSNVVL